jgi:C4-dicarboxylate-binding protein DctP
LEYGLLEKQLIKQQIVEKKRRLKMKKILRTALSSIVILGLILIIGNNVAFCKAKYTAALAHNQVTVSNMHKGMVKFKEIVEKQTNGEIEINIHPSSELGDAPDLMIMTESGAIQMSALTSGMLGGVWKEAQLFDLPFLLSPNYDVNLKLLNGRLGKAIEEDLKKRNLRVLGYITISLKQFIGNKPITSPADFNGLKWRTMKSPLIIETYKTLGSSPATVDYHEVYTALQMGIVDGFELGVSYIGIMKFYEVAKYLIISNHGGYVLPIFVNKNWFEKLPDKHQKIMTEAAWDAANFILERDKADEKKWYDIIDKYPKTTITHLTPEAVQSFKDVLVKPLRADYIEMVGKGGEKLLKIWDEDLAKEMQK